MLYVTQSTSGIILKNHFITVEKNYETHRRCRLKPRLCWLSRPAPATLCSHPESPSLNLSPARFCQNLARPFWFGKSYVAGVEVGWRLPPGGWMGSREHRALHDVQEAHCSPVGVSTALSCLRVEIMAWKGRRSISWKRIGWLKKDNMNDLTKCLGRGTVTYANPRLASVDGWCTEVLVLTEGHWTSEGCGSLTYGCGVVASWSGVVQVGGIAVTHPRVEGVDLALRRCVSPTAQPVLEITPRVRWNRTCRKRTSVGKNVFAGLEPWVFWHCSLWKAKKKQFAAFMPPWVSQLSRQFFCDFLITPKPIKQGKNLLLSSLGKRWRRFLFGSTGGYVNTTGPCVPERIFTCWMQEWPKQQSRERCHGMSVNGGVERRIDDKNKFSGSLWAVMWIDAERSGLWSGNPELTIQQAEPELGPDLHYCPKNPFGAIAVERFQEKKSWSPWLSPDLLGLLNLHLLQIVPSSSSPRIQSLCKSHV